MKSIFTKRKTQKLSDINSPIHVKTLFLKRFSEFSEEVIDGLIALGDLLELDPNEKAIEQGEQTNEVYFLITGRLNVIHTDRFGTDRILNEISAGEVFGEMALFTNQKRSTSIIAKRHCTLLKIPCEAFQQFIDQNNAVYKYISLTLIRRLAQSNERTKKNDGCKNITLLPIDPSYDIAAFSNRLLKTLSKFGKVLLVDQKTIDAKNLEGYQFLNWLYQTELDYNYVLFVGAYENSPWQKIIVEQSDKLLLVGKQKNSIALSPVERSIYQNPKQSKNLECCLVLDSIELPEIKNTRSCLEERKVSTILHLRNEKDYARISRFLSGNAIKLVLAGGGARGFAHLGVYKAMLELGIPVDLVGGTSIGGLMSAVIACGWEYEDIIKAGHQTFVKESPLSDYQLPIVSLLKGARLDKTLNNSFGDLYIEDLVIPYFAVASNLSKLSTEIMNSGLLKKAVRASISLPSILPPVVKDNDLLLDGGIVDNMPYDPMQQLADGPTIGVDLSSIKKRKLGYDKIPSNGQIALSKITGSKKHKVPNIYQIIMGTMTLSSDEKKRANEKKFDLYIKPEVSRFGFLDLKKFHEIIEVGYRDSLEVMGAWWDQRK